MKKIFAATAVGQVLLGGSLLLNTGPVAQADPGQNCKTEWNTMYNVPVGVRTTCFTPDGSYRICTSLGTDGQGPGTCWEYPAPPQIGGQPTFNPPVPGMP